MSVQMQPSQLTPADIAQIEKNGQQWVEYSLARDFEGLTSNLLTEDVRLMPPDHPVCLGRAAALDYLKAYPEIQAFSITTDDVTGRADLAIARGSFDITVTMDGQTIRQVGKWLGVNEKTKSGWKITHDTWNADAPLT